MKLKHLLFSVLCALSLTLVGTSLFAQNFQWVEQANSQNYIITNDVAHDAAGNSYVVGRYNYGTTVEVGQLSITGSGYLLIKYDPIGNVLWARTTQASSGNRTVPNSVAVDKSGNVFVTGYFVNNTTFVAPNRSISLNRISTLPSGNPETFLVKYDQNGDLNWATAAGGTPVVTFDGANGVAVDTMGNAYITGEYQRNTRFNSVVGNPITIPGSVSNSRDVFVAKYNTNGQVLWVRSAGGSGHDAGRAVSCTPNGKVLVTGIIAQTNNDVLFGAVLAPKKSNFDIFLTQYDSNGNLEWVSTYGSETFNSVTDLATDSQGNAFLTGNFKGLLLLPASLSMQAYNFAATNPAFSAFMIKVNPAGNTVWASRGGTLTNEDVRANGVSVDAQGNSYFIGEYFSDPQFANFPNLPIPATTSTGLADLYVVKMSPAGQFLWFKSAGSDSTDSGASISVKENGCSLWGTGNFTKTASFDTLQRTSVGGADVYTFRMYNCPAGGTLTGGPGGPPGPPGPPAPCLCSGNNSGTLTLSDESGIIRNWESSTECNNFSNPVTINNTTNTHNWSNLTTTTCFRVRVEIARNVFKYSNTRQICVQPTPAAPQVTGNPVICYGGVTQLFANGNPNNQYTWWDAPQGGNLLGSGNPFQTPPMYANQVIYVQAKIGNCTSVRVPYTLAVIPQIVGTFFKSNVRGCAGNRNGMLLIGGSGGSGQLQYSIDGGQTWQNQGNYFNLPAGTYTLRVRDALYPMCSQTIASAVVLTEPAPLNAQVVVIPSNTCNTNGNGALTVRNQTGGSGSYQYSINNGLTWQLSANFVNLQAGVYIVRMRDSQHPNCTPFIQTVVVNSVNNQQIVATGPQVACVGQSVPVAVTGAATYEWQPANLVSNVNSPTPMFMSTQPGTFTLTVTGMTPNGCSSTASVTIMVSQPFLQATASQFNVCPGSGPVVLQATGTPGTYIWYPGQQVGNVYTVIPTVTTTYTVKLTDQAGCTAQQTVTVNVKPKPNVVATTLQHVTCTQPGVILAQYVGNFPNGQYSYSWQPGNLQGQQHNVSPTQTTIYTVTILDNQTGCTNTAQTTVFNNRQNITAQIGGLLQVYPNNHGPVTMTGNPSGGTFFGPGVEGNVFNPSTLEPGVHTICYEGASEGCPFSTCTIVQIIDGENCPPPQTGYFTLVNNNTFTYNFQSIAPAIAYEMTVENVNTLAKTTYIIPGTQHPSLVTYTVNSLQRLTIYRIKVRTICANQLKSTWAQDVFVYMTPRLGDIVVSGQETQLTVYPNPNKGRFTVSFGTETSTPQELVVMDLSGREIYRQTLSAGQSEYIVELPEVAAGLYLLRVPTSEGVGVHKLMID